MEFADALEVCSAEPKKSSLLGRCWWNYEYSIHHDWAKVGRQM